MTLQELLDEVVVLGGGVVLEILKVLHHVTLLFPEVGQFLELHLGLHVENVLHTEVVNVSVSFELLSDLGLHLRGRDVQIVGVDELSGVSQVPPVEGQHTVSHFRVGGGESSSLGQGSGGGHGCSSLKIV